MSEISKIQQNLIIKKIDQATVNISINDNDMLMAIVGQFDQNLKNLSKLTIQTFILEAILLLAKEIKKN